MTNDDFSELTNFLFTIEHWGRYELTILGNSVHAINIETLDRILSELIYKNRLFENEEKNVMLKVQLLINSIIHALNLKRVDLATKYLSIIQSFGIIDTAYMYEITLCRFFRNVINLITLPSEHDSQEIQDLLDGLKLLDFENIRWALEDQLVYYKEIYHI